MVRVGVVGAGVMGATHAAILCRSIAGATLAAVSDSDDARVAPFVGKPDVRVYSSPTELIDSADVDAVIIASPDNRHEEQVLACLAAAKPVLCEKPLAPTSEACRAILDRERGIGGRLIQVGFMRRFDPAYRDLKAAYDSGAVGAALLVRCAHRNLSAPGFFEAGMAITNAMVHEFDICRWLLDARIVAVRVDRPRRAGVILDDPVLATLEMSGGQLVTIEVFMNAAYGYDIRTEIVGESGVLTMGAPAATGFLSRSEPGTRVPADFRLRFEDAYRLQIQEWVRSMATGEHVGAGADDGLQAALAAEAAGRSLRSGAWEAVQPG